MTAVTEAAEKQRAELEQSVVDLLPTIITCILGIASLMTVPAPITALHLICALWPYDSKKGQAAHYLSSDISEYLFRIGALPTKLDACVKAAHVMEPAIRSLVAYGWLLHSSNPLLRTIYDMEPPYETEHPKNWRRKKPGENGNSERRHKRRYPLENAMKYIAAIMDGFGTKKWRDPSKSLDRFEALSDDGLPVSEESKSSGSLKFYSRPNRYSFSTYWRAPNRSALVFLTARPYLKRLEMNYDYDELKELVKLPEWFSDKRAHHIPVGGTVTLVSLDVLATIFSCSKEDAANFMKELGVGTIHAPNGLEYVNLWNIELAIARKTWPGLSDRELLGKLEELRSLCSPQVPYLHTAFLTAMAGLVTRLIRIRAAGEKKARSHSGELILRHCPIDIPKELIALDPLSNESINELPKDQVMRVPGFATINKSIRKRPSKEPLVSNRKQKPHTEELLYKEMSLDSGSKKENITSDNVDTVERRLQA